MSTSGPQVVQVFIAGNQAEEIDKLLAQTSAQVEAFCKAHKTSHCAVWIVLMGKFLRCLAEAGHETVAKTLQDKIQNDYEFNVRPQDEVVAQELSRELDKLFFPEGWGQTLESKAERLGTVINCVGNACINLAGAMWGDDGKKTMAELMEDAMLQTFERLVPDYGPVN
jgi:hypothetical protein